VCTVSGCASGRVRGACLIGDTPGIEVQTAPGKLGCDTDAPVSPPASTAPAAPLPEVRIGTFQGRAPGSIAMSADGNGNLVDLVWSDWTATGARASGLDAWNNCTPNCAQGTFTDIPITVRLSGPRGGLFTVLTLNWPTAYDRDFNTYPHVWFYPHSWPEGASYTGSG
jgi:hypothetical protein